MLGVAGRVLECVAFEPDLVDGFFDGVEAAAEFGVFFMCHWQVWYKAIRRRNPARRIATTTPCSEVGCFMSSDTP